VIVCFIDIGGIVDHTCLNFLFINKKMFSCLLFVNSRVNFDDKQIWLYKIGLCPCLLVYVIYIGCFYLEIIIIFGLCDQSFKLKISHLIKCLSKKKSDQNIP
jgi:hypothetical protein